MRGFQELIKKLLGNDENAYNAYFSFYDKPLSKTIKIILHKIKTIEFEKLAKEFSWTLEKPAWVDRDETYHISRDDEQRGLWKHRLHQSWFFYIQELAASSSAPALFPIIKKFPNGYFLDMCAAPWGKSIQLADKLLIEKWWWILVSNEITTSRIPPLEHNIKRVWTYNTCITSYSWEMFWQIAPNFFDWVLVDAPCSGEWISFKSQWGIKHWSEEQIKKIANLQKKLLSSAIETCKPWWEIVYSTCTINPWENEFVVQFALENYKESIELIDVPIAWKSFGIETREGETLLGPLQPKKVARFWPHIHHTGWFFIAMFRKKESTQWEYKNTSSRRSQLDSSDTLQDQIIELLSKDYWIQINKDQEFFVATDTQVYLTSPTAKQINEIFFTKKLWIPIFKKTSHGELIPLHSLGNIFWARATKNSINLNHIDLQKYSEWFDIQTTELVDTENNYCIIKSWDLGISVWKIVNWYIKNKFLR